MSISIFYLPTYKDMLHISRDVYLKGKVASCKETELEDFLPIWSRITQGKNHPGDRMKLKKRILDIEYNMYPIVFIDSHCWSGDESKKSHGYSCVHIVQKQQQNLKWCKTYDHHYIDRNVGVIILEKTHFHGGLEEPDFKYWFYEKDKREKLPYEVLKESFRQVDIMKKERVDGIFLSIEKLAKLPSNFFEDDIPLNISEYEHKYEKAYGYLNGEDIRQLVKKNTISTANCISCKLIQWDNCWNFVISDEYGSRMFKVDNEEAERFLMKYQLFC